MTWACLALALNYLSWTLLCLGLPRHYQQHFGHVLSPARAHVLRLCGWLLALLALVLALRQHEPTIAVVIWAATWMLAAVIWVLLQPYRPRVARVLAPLLLALSLTVYLI
jgi:hypothetical protein